MTVKEIIEKTTINDVMDEVSRMNICTFYEDFKLFMEVYDDLKNSTERKRKFSLVFFNGPYDFPHAMKVSSNGRRQILVANAKSVANCDILDKTGKLSELEMLTYLIFHLVALLQAETPYDFLAKRHNVDLME